ncbi:MAG: hypothetical protein ACHQ2E_07175 [Gemmatimonadales bacterium]
MTSARRRVTLAAVLALLLLSELTVPTRLLAQSGPYIHVSALAIPSYTSVDPVPGGNGLDEFRVTQAMLMFHAGAFTNRLRLLGTFNAEGWTMPQGELGIGVWGEGYYDRRHPHTYVTELMLVGDQPLGPDVRVSLDAGKGFAPYGSDDPMNRPTVIFPVNHHWGQIMERAVLIGGVTWKVLTFEAGIFNGDEPEYPSQWPNMDRFGDSWSARLTVRPMVGLEFQGSHALVKSPENRAGAGLENDKWSVSGRADRPLWGGQGYLFGEWARNSEASGTFVFRSFLFEGAWSRGRHRPYYRYENSDRPEETRTADPFHAPRPVFENSIVGTTRWSINILGYGYQFGRANGLSVQPMLEVSNAFVESVNGGIFDPQVFYGGQVFWSLTAAVRIGWSMAGHRMGRYGVLADPPATEPMAHHQM